MEKTIVSILDNDLYKFSMSYAYMKLYPESQGTFTFTDRNKTIYTKEFVDRLRSELENLSNLTLTFQEFKWASERLGRYIPLHYWEWLKTFRYCISKINLELSHHGQLILEVTDNLYKLTLYEVPLLALISQITAEINGHSVEKTGVISTLSTKIELSNTSELYFSEFGTRRRFSHEVQDIVCSELSQKAKYCTGTSNVYFAMKYNMTPIGTVAHEWFMFHGALYGYREANYKALEAWVDVYDGDLGIALTDTYTSKVFFDNFSKKHAKLFDGVRHDSGDPLKYVDMTLDRYKDLNIDPTTKTIIFSNALTMVSYSEIAKYCKGKIKCAAGIGTHLTNDTGNPTSNIVMKLTKVRMSCRKDWYYTVKISDDQGKHMGPDYELNICKLTLNY